MSGGVVAQVRVLGPVGAVVDGRPIEVGGPRQRCLLAALAIDAGEVVPADRLIERLWADGGLPAFCLSSRQLSGIDKAGRRPGRPGSPMLRTLKAAARGSAASSRPSL